MAAKKKVVKKVVEAVEVAPDVPVEPAKPQYSAEGVLLNPQDFHVSPEGLLKAKE